MAQYYTLEEAAKLLGTSPDELKLLAKKGELRPFQDRGTLRFRSQEIDEMARRRGRGSEPDLQLGEATRPSDTPAGKKKSKVDPGVFDFSLTPEDSGQVEIGQELRGGSAGGGPKSKGPASSKKLGPVSPAPKPGSDSDVRLVADGSDLGFQIASDSDVKVVEDPASSKLPPVPSSSKSKLNRPKSKVQIDSGARLADSDSDVKIVPDGGEVNLGGKPPSSGTDSDVRLNLDSGGKRKSGLGRGPDAMLTEEIDLDAELRQAEEAARSKGRSAKPRSGEAQLPTSSPFELSVDDLELPAPKKKSASTDSSSDFELTPAAPESSGELSLDPEEEEVGLGELSGGAGASGINLQDPADSGISLEQSEGSDEIEFELSLDAESTPKPAPAAPDIDSDSEFELTLDDSGGLAPMEEETPAVAEDEKDIFETDFEVPALDEESGSQAVALGESDTDLESSDFDLALGDEDIAADEESGSQVVALEDEEETDDAAATVAGRRRPAAAADEEDEVDDLLGGGLTADEEVEEDEELATAPAGARGAAVETAPAEWGPVPALVLMPCVIVLFLLGLLGFELVHGMWGYRQPNKVTGVLIDPIARMFTEDLPPPDKTP